MHKVPWWNTQMGELERNALMAAYDRRALTQGAITDEFEKKLAEKLQVPYVVVTTSGTSAIMMALLAAGIGPGDEVIVPALTWIATANAPAMLGAKIVLADCQPNSPLIDVEALKKKVTSRTRAILPVHLDGRACDLQAIKAIAKDAGAFVIEDACKAFCSKTENGYLGTIGDFGCFSFGMISMVSVCYGGAVATRDAKMYEKLKLIRNQGVPRRGEESYETLSGNFKASDLLASIGIAQLSRFDEKLAQVKKIYQRYQEGLAKVKCLSIIPVDVSTGKIPLCTEARSKMRSKIIAGLAEMQVEALPFHLPLHRAAYLKDHGNYPNASAFGDEGFILPSGPGQSLDDIDRSIAAIQELDRRGEFSG